MTQPKALVRIQQIEKGLDRMRPEIKALLPPDVPVDRFVRVTLNALLANPGLATGDLHSFKAACLRAAQDGLVPDGREAAFVQFRDSGDGPSRVQYVPMVYGILKTLYESPEIVHVGCKVVYDGDEFSTWTDESGDHVRHVPCMDSATRGKFKLAYATAKTKRGGSYVEPMTIDELEDVRKCSRAKKGGPWFSFPDEMRKKTVLKRLAKRLPLPDSVHDAISVDDIETYDMPDAPAEIQAQHKQQNEPSRLRKALDIASDDSIDPETGEVLDRSEEFTEGSRGESTEEEPI